jgi:hypothetical protein
MADDYRDHITQARDLLELASQTAEGRAAVKRWTGQVAAALPDEDPEDASASEPGTAWNENALARGGLTQEQLVGLSETGDPGCELYPAALSDHYATSPAPGVHDNGRQQAMDYDEADLRFWHAQDEVARLSLLTQGGPARPSYAGVQLSEPAGRDELDAADLTLATFELAARAGSEVTFSDAADAVDELALSRSPRDVGTPSARAGALAELARRLPAADDPADEEAALALARQGEVSRIARQYYGRGAGEDPRVAEIVERNGDVLSDYPRGRGQTYVAQLEDEDPTDRKAPRRGGQVHSEVARYLAQADALLGREDPHGANRTTPVKSALQREAEEQRARAGHAPGLRSITDRHRGALRTGVS